MTALTDQARRRRRGINSKRTKRIVAIIRGLFLSLISLMILVPIAAMFLASFKTVPDFFGNPYGLPSVWAFDNYSRAWQEAHVSTTLPNTIFVTACSVLGSVFLASLIAFGLSRDLRVLHHLRAALLGLRDDFGGTRTRFLDRLLGLLARDL